MVYFHMCFPQQNAITESKESEIWNEALPISNHTLELPPGANDICVKFVIGDIL